MQIPVKKDAHSVAITGMSCRFPGDGDNVESFWESICQARSAWSEIPKDRFNADAFCSSNGNRNTSITRGAHFLKQNISAFDANFFNLTKAEAEAMDPQHRMMIEVSYEALENAGIPLHQLAGTRTGVFMGQWTSDYREMLFRDAETAPKYTASGSSKTSLANRISWLFDLKGPSFTMDTACSSSLVAMHLACQSLRCGESDIAIVGGVNLLLNPDMFMYMSNQGFLSPDGKCKSFDESGDGYGRGEGFAAIILKRIDDAIVLGDPIRAVIRGTASNQDGHTRGFFLPSADAQATLIEETYRAAGLSFEDTHYIEAHGTGTQAGDVQETTALSKTISKLRSPTGKLLIGSVKSNIGHLEACAGLAAIIKTVYILESGLIPPTIHFKKGNPEIKFDEWNLEVPTKLTPWPTEGLRRISTNSFGYGGTNCHAILDDTSHYLQDRGIYGRSDKVHVNRAHNKGTYNNFTNASEVHANEDSKLNGPVKQHGPRVFLLSAQDKDGLKRIKKSIADFLDEMSERIKHNSIEEENFLTDLAHTLNARRSLLCWKTYGIATSLKGLCQTWRDDQSTALVSRSSRSVRIGFIFTGQGAQWARMGAELIRYTVFRESVEAADSYIRTHLKCTWSIVEELQKTKTTSRLHLAVCSQTLCTVLQVALVELLRTWNISPVAVAGHSAGEMAAAYCIGAIRREDAWKVAYWRGVLSSGLKTIAPDISGAMMAVGLTPDAAKLLISKTTKGRVIVACVNAPTSVTLSGDAAAIDELAELLKDSGVFARKLQVDTAYHSHHMQILASDCLDAIADIKTLKPSTTRNMHSCVTGFGVEPSELGPSYWVKNMTSPVYFAPAVHDLLRPMDKKGVRATQNAVDVLVEIGPHCALQGPTTQTLKANGITNIPYMSALVRNQDAITSMLNLVGSLVAQGFPIELSRANNDDRNSSYTPKPLTNLPKYNWNHTQKYWTESRIGKEYRLRKKPHLSLLGAPAPSIVAGESIWRGFVRLSEEPWVADHKIHGAILYPAAGFLAMAIEAAVQNAKNSRDVAAFRLRDVQFIAAAVATEESDLEFTLQLRPHITGTRTANSIWLEFVISSSGDGTNLQKNCSGLMILEYESENSQSKSEQAAEAAKAHRQYQQAESHCGIVVNTAKFYADMSTIGLIYGPSFANLTQIRGQKGQACGMVEVPNVSALAPKEFRSTPHVIHPGTLDAIFHLAFAALGERQLRSAMVPKSIDEVIISANISSQAGTQLAGFANAEKHGFKDMQADITIFENHRTEPVVQISGLCCSEVGGGNSGQSEAKKICSRLTWQPAIEFLSLEQQETVIETHKVTDLAPRRHFNSLAEEIPIPDHTVFIKTQSLVAIRIKLIKFLKLLHHTNPLISILELQTGASPMVRLAEQEEFHSLLRTCEYTIASPSKNYHPQTDKLVATSKDKVKREVLNIEEDLHSQEFGDRKFDAVVCFDMLNSDFQPEMAMANVKQLLKPTGAACLVDATDQGKQSFAIDSVNSRSGELHQLLDRHGLMMNFQVSDFTKPEVQQLTLTIGTPDNTLEHIKDTEIVLITRPNASPASEEIVAQLAKLLKSQSYSITNFVWGSDLSVLTGKHCLALLELDHSMMYDLSERDFVTVRQLILEAKSTFWVVGHDEPSAAMITGLARVVRNEVPGIDFRTFLYDRHSQVSNWEVTVLVAKVLGSTSPENEFVVKSGVVNICRVDEDTALNSEIELLKPNSSKRTATTPLGQVKCPQKLCALTPGLIESLCFEADELALSELSTEMVEINVKATSLRSREVMSVMGQIPDTLLGLGAAGIVTRVGSAVSKFQVGDRVSMIGRGAHRTVLRSRAQYCELIPHSMSFQEASIVPSVHATAWYGLVQLARVKKGQSILVHAAAGGVGQAAMQIAKHFGMTIFATVDSDIKRELVREVYQIPNDHILDSQDLSFAKSIKRMTDGRGVDVVLNSSSTGEALRQTWYCIAPFGHFLEVGLKDILGNTELDMRPFLRNATFTYFSLDDIAEGAVETMAEILDGTWDFQRRGITKPISPVTTHPISDVVKAFKLVQTDKYVGDVVLTWSDEISVPVIQSSKASSLRLDPNAAYLLVGGLGGLGRSISTVLADLGARKLCFLSRSGDDSPQAQSLVVDLRERKVDVKIYVCDVANEKAVVNATRRCTQELGKIKGVFQCAMVLRDALFTNMTHRDWVEATRPKVQGSWNLHNQLKEVDFFITLSSFAAVIGNRGQGNYAAAGAYEDTLSYYRRARGMHAVTIDLGIMRDIGVLAENGMVDAFRDWEKPYGMCVADFHALIKQAMFGDINQDIAPQILTGIATGGSAIDAGIASPFYLEDARFAIMAATDLEMNCADGGGLVSTENRISQAGSLEEASQVVEEVLVLRIAQILQTPTSEIDTGRFLHSYGIDSLVAIEVVNWALKEIKSSITVFDVMAGIPITTTATKIAMRSARLPTELLPPS